jgi:hypothetical protein
VFKVGGSGSGGDDGHDRTHVANLSSAAPSFSVSGLAPGSHYEGEIIGVNVKGVGVPHVVKVYTLKLPEKLIPQIPIEPPPSKWVDDM